MICTIVLRYLEHTDCGVILLKRKKVELSFTLNNGADVIAPNKYTLHMIQIWQLKTR